MNLINKSRISLLLKRILPDNMVLPILKGNLKHKKWIIQSSMLECILGNYEVDKSNLFRKKISFGNIVYDIGAHVGHYTLLASSLVGDEGKVVSFEPLPQNFKYLQSHIELNKCKNVMAIEAAVSDFCGNSRFKLGNDKDRDNSYLGYLDKNGEISVKTITLYEFLIRNPELKPDCIKIDVEGAEMQVLRGANSTINEFNPNLFIATHNKTVHNECMNYLKNIGYCIEFINGQEDEIFAYK